MNHQIFDVNHLENKTKIFKISSAAVVTGALLFACCVILHVFLPSVDFVF